MTSLIMTAAQWGRIKGATALDLETRDFGTDKALILDPKLFILLREAYDPVESQALRDYAGLLLYRQALTLYNVLTFHAHQKVLSPRSHTAALWRSGQKLVCSTLELFTGPPESPRPACSAAGAAQGRGHRRGGAAQHGVQHRGARVLGEAVQLL